MTFRVLLLALLAGTAAADDPPAATHPKKQREEMALKYTDAGLPSPDTVWGAKEYPITGGRGRPEGGGRATSARAR